jgi:tetratricopeptide (TPR) repeat protein
MIASFVTLGVLVWAVYANALSGPFVFDDFHVIPNNPSVRGPSDVPSFFVDVSTFSVLPGNRDYRPLFLTSMALSWWAGGGETLPFHVTSIMLHTGNVILLFLILGRVFSRRSDPVGGLPPVAAFWAAFSAAVLFAVHPLTTESVNYISSQSVPLAAFFLLLSFYLFLVTYGWGPPQSGNAVTRLRLAASYTAYFLALLSKPIAIVLPLLLILWELAFGNKSKDADEPFWRQCRQRAVKHLPYFLITILFLAIRAVVVPTTPTTAASGGQSIGAIYVHYLTQTKAMVFYYLQQAVLPFDLNVDRAYQPSTTITDPKVLLAIAVFVLIVGFLVRYRRHGNIVFWTLWFPACLLLTTYVVILGQTVNEHRVYISLAGFCALTGYVFVKLISSFPASNSGPLFKKRMGASLIVIAAGLLIVGLGNETRQRNVVWKSEFSLWENAARNEGSWRAHMNYGLALEAKGRGEEALFQFEKAVRLGPYAFSYLNLGNAQVTRGNFDTGIANLRTAVSLWPTAPEPHLYLGYGLSRVGRLREAESEMRRALEIRPNYPKAYRFLADIFEQQDRKNEAIATLQSLVNLDPSQTWASSRIRRIKEGNSAIQNSEMYRRFAVAFSHQKAGRLNQAIAGYEQLLKDQPDHIQGRFNLAVALHHQGKCAGAIRHFERVLTLQPSYSGAHWHLAECYRTLGDEDKAASHAKSYQGRL